jgi:hypothetical protein
MNMKRNQNMKRRSPSPPYSAKGLQTMLLRPVLLLLMLPLLLNACSDEQGTTGSETAVLSIGQVTTKTLKTRSTTAVTSGDIGVFLSGTDYTTQSNVKYSYGTTWSTINPLYLTSTSASICAYYPYSATITDATAVPLTSQIYSSSADLCYAANTSKTSASPSIDFVMSRAYAMITFNIIHEETYTGACSISNIAVSNAGINASGTLNMTTGVMASTTAGTVNITPSSAITVATNATSSIQALMVPVSTAMTGYVTVTFTVDGVRCVAAIDASSLSTLVAGTNYTINASMKKTGVNITLESISGAGNMSLIATPANCYIVAPSNAITIPVNIKGNGGDVAGTGLSTSHTATSVGVLWQTVADLITVTGFNSSTQTVIINAGAASGNAVIAAYDTDGTTILWSWHIWVTSYDPNTPSNGAIYNYSNRIWMDRNLGATTITPATVTTFGLLYQWGRKDPFPNSTSASGGVEPTLVGKHTSVTKMGVSATYNLTNAILNPVTLYCNGDYSNYYDWYSVGPNIHNDGLWGGYSQITPTAKTIFDPCPAGWRVPAFSNSSWPWISIATGVSTPNAEVIPWTGDGRIYAPVNTYYPAAGQRDLASGSLYSMGSDGYYWTATAAYPGEFTASSFVMYLNNSKFRSYGGYRASGYSIRCVQE